MNIFGLKWPVGRLRIQTCQLSRFCRESHNFFVISYSLVTRFPISRVFEKFLSKMKELRLFNKKGIFSYEEC